MPTRPTAGPQGWARDIEQRVRALERERMWRLPWAHTASGPAGHPVVCRLVAGRRYRVDVAATVNPATAGRVTLSVLVDDNPVGVWLNEELPAGPTLRFGWVDLVAPDDPPFSEVEVKVTGVESGTVTVLDLGGG